MQLQKQLPDKISREARLGGLRPVHAPSLRDVNRRRLQIWVVTTILVAALGAANLLLQAVDGVTPEPWLTPVLRYSLFLLGVAFCAYAIEKELHLRRLETLLIGSRLKADGLSLRLQETLALLEAARATNSVLALEDVLNVILRSAIELLGARGGSVMLVEEPDTLRRVCVLGDEPLPGSVLQLGEGVPGTVAQTRQPLLVDFDEDAADFVDSEQGNLMSVPLINRGELLGILELRAIPDRPFARNDLDVLCMITEQAASAVANAHLYERERAHVEELLAHDRVKSQLIAMLTNDQILKAVAFAAEWFPTNGFDTMRISEVFERLGEAAGVSRVYVGERGVSESGTEITRLYEWSALGRRPADPNVSRKWCEGWPRWEPQLRDRMVISANAKGYSEEEWHQIATDDAQAVVVAPIFVGDEWWGLMGFEDCIVEREWTQSEIDALKTAAGIVGGAIARYQLAQARNAAEAKYRMLVEQLPAVTYLDKVEDVASDRLIPLYISPQVEEMLGYPRDAWMEDGSLCETLLHPDDRDRVLALRRELPTGEPFRAEYRLVRHDGRIVWIREEAAVLRDEAAGCSYWQGVMYDITDQKGSEEKVSQLAAIVEASADAILSVNLADMTIRSWNEGAERIFGLEAREIVGRPLSLLMPPDREDESAAILHRIRRGEHVRSETQWVTNDGSQIDVSLSISPILDSDGNIVAASAIARDITDRKRAERELELSLDQLRETDRQRRQLLTRLVSAQEEERRRIAGDIHDDPIQKMTAAGLRLGILRNQLDDRQQLAALDKLEEMIESAIARLRNLLFELRPRALDTGGIAAALRDYLDQSFEGEDIKVRLENRLAVEPPIETRVIAYRIAQEALTNVRKHAGADNVTVTLLESDGGLLMRIEDDGTGIRQTELGRSLPGHLGLTSMRERAEVAGGWVGLHSMPGAGTIVECWLPTQGAGGAEETLVSAAVLAS